MPIANWQAEIRELDAQIACIRQRKASLKAAIDAAERSGKDMAGGSRSKCARGSNLPRDKSANPRGHRTRQTVSL